MYLAPSWSFCYEVLFDINNVKFSLQDTMFLNIVVPKCKIMMGGMAILFTFECWRYLRKRSWKKSFWGGYSLPCKWIHVGVVERSHVVEISNCHTTYDYYYKSLWKLEHFVVWAQQMILIYWSWIKLDCQDEDYFHAQLISFGLFKTKGSQVTELLQLKIYQQKRLK